MTKSEFIRAELGKLPQAEFLDDSVKIICPFHNDHNPSLDVSLIHVEGKVGVGGFNCWSCEDGHGGWNKLALKLGLALWEHKGETDPSIEQNPFASFRFESLTEKKAYRKPITDGLWAKPWRGLSAEFMRQMGVEELWDREFNEYVLWIPFRNSKQKLIGHILARDEGSQIPNGLKYRNNKGLDSDRLWFCLDQVPSRTVPVLVEGPFDTLRYRAAGIPAIGGLGVSTLAKPIKYSALVGKGITQVILAFDADQAGRVATEAAIPILKDFGIEAIDLDLRRYRQNPLNDNEKIDPGNAPVESIQDIKSFLGLAT